MVVLYFINLEGYFHLFILKLFNFYLQEHQFQLK